MRPLLDSGVIPENPSLGDGASGCFTSQATAPRMSFILADEAGAEASLPSPCPLPISPREHRKQPIHNLQGDCAAPNRESSSAPSPHTSRGTSTLQSREVAPQGPISTTGSSPTHLQTPPSVSASQPMTPLLYGMSGSCSAISSSASQPNSVVGSLSEYQESFVMSAFSASEPGQPQNVYVTEGTQQFVMPTINVPGRRPFTEVGKSIGQLKILVAGKSGLGKTSLITAMTHSCQHIVHVDPTVPVAMASTGLLPANTLPNQTPIAQGTFQITETFASTKPFPPWWKDSAQSDSVSDSVRAGDAVLDRNICLVDTPGYQASGQPTDTFGQVSRYVEFHLQKSRFDGLTDAELLRTISGGGSSLVDAVLYMIPSSGLSSIDTQYLRRLEPLTTVIPLLAHADVLTKEHIVAGKKLVARQLAEAGLGLFSFTSSTSDANDSSIYAISSRLGSDRDAMDASLLMSSEYVQPLVPTDLAQLLDRIFNCDGASWLRHASAKKLLRWRSRHSTAGNIPSAFTRQSDSSMGSRLLRQRAESLTTFAMNRVPIYSLHEERFCRVQFTNWAADLQRSLANERAMQEKRVREQAASWLNKTWSGSDLSLDCSRAALALTRTRGRGERQHSRSRRLHKPSSDQNWAAVRHQDPLGLLQFRSEFCWQGWNALEMVGGLGILGGLAWLLV